MSNKPKFRVRSTAIGWTFFDIATGDKLGAKFYNGKMSFYCMRFLSKNKNLK